MPGYSPSDRHFQSPVRVLCLLKMEGAALAGVAHGLMYEAGTRKLMLSHRQVRGRHLSTRLTAVELLTVEALAAG